MARPARPSAQSRAAPARTVSYAFADHLDALVRNPGEKRKGERTRDRILAATARLLDERGFRGLRHTDICEAADIGVATFYIYFEDKLGACRAVLEGFVAFIQSLDDPGLALLREAARNDPDPYLAIFFSNLGVLRLAAANRGLFRCFLESVSETDELLRIWRDFSHGWYGYSLRGLKKRGVPGSTDDLMFRTALAGGMVDEALRALFVVGDDRMAALAGKVASGDIALAQHLSAAWYRIVVGASPPDMAPKIAAKLASP